MLHRLKFACSLLLVLSVIPAAAAAPPVVSSIEKQSAWTGEPVPMVVTLYAPGPFSGTAVFDFPDLPKTAFLATGRPIVGSETEGDETFMTQRHEFNLYTQQTGEVVIPPFQVRFEWKESFASDPQSINGETKPLKFRSDRPPGTESLGIVIAANSMSMTQSWAPEQGENAHAGDVFERTIQRSATGTTAMMIPPASDDAPEGVRVYRSDPTVEDRSGRGETTAVRNETIKYQFEKAGNYQLPSLNFVWWDSGTNELKTESLPGLSVNVTAAKTDPETQPPTRPISHWQTVVFLVVGIGLGALVLRKPFSSVVAVGKAIRNRPDNVAARRLQAACKRNDPEQAYEAALHFHRLVLDPAILDSDDNRNFQTELDALSRRLFSAAPDHTHWSGESLLRSFIALRQKSRAAKQKRKDATSLSPLNPNQI